MELDMYGELEGRSRECYELVMPAIDMIEEGNDLVVTIDLPASPRRILTSEL